MFPFEEKQYAQELGNMDPSMLSLQYEKLVDDNIMSPLSGSPLETFATTLGHQNFFSMSAPNNYNEHIMTPSTYGSFANQEEDGTRVSVEALTEKRRKRRESHNMVERKRRDLINEKIQELSSFLPEFASDAQHKPNKGTVLRRSVEYIRHMQIFAARQMDRTMELEHVLLKVCRQYGIKESDLGLSMPLGTPIQLPAMSTTEVYDEDGN